MRNPVISALAGILLASAASIATADSLYDESSYRPLVSDKRAHLPGDSLTVLIYENSSATTTADTALQRKSDVGLQANIDQNNHNLGVTSNNDFDGGGTVQRSGQLLATITARVTQVAPNGDLLIAGEQEVEVNSDQQRIHVEGRVRPLDISENNTVMSYRIADAKISYVGAGDLANHQRPGILSRFFSWIGL